MIFLWASVLPCGVAALFFGLRYYLPKKKESSAFSFFADAVMPDGLASLLLSLLIALLVLLLFPHYSSSSFLLFFLSQSVLMDWLRPVRRIWHLSKEKQNPFANGEKKNSIRDLLLLAVVALEIFAFHPDSYRGRKVEVIGTISQVSSPSIKQEDGSILWENANPLEIHDIDTDNDTFFLDFATENLGAQIRFRTRESGNTSSNAWSAYQTYNVNLAYPEDVRFALPRPVLSSYENHQYDLQIVAFYSHEEQASSHLLHLKAVRFNAPLYFAISYLRLFGLEALILLLSGVTKAFMRHTKTDVVSSKRPRSAFAKSMEIAGAISFFALAVFLAISWIYRGRYYTAYPFDESLLPESGYSYLYYRLFDALRHGQFSLRIDPDPKLIALENPYDISMRSGVKYLWDCAYYQGHYYCYFGIGPVLFVMFPVYFLTGCTLVPTGAFVLQLAILVTALEFLFLGPLWNKATGERIRYPMAFCMGILAFFASAFPLMFKDNFIDWQYWVAFNWGIANLVAFLGLTLCAYSFPQARLSLFPCIGFAFVALLLSRPDLCFSVIVLSPLFFRMMFDHNVSGKRRIISFASIFSVLAIGMGFAFYYNVKRFGNPFEFGSSYQLTVMDQRELHLTLNGVVAGAFHFFFQPWVPADSFPLVRCSAIVTPLSYHLYTMPTVGVFTNLFSWGILLPFLLWKGATWEKKATYILLYPVFLLYAGLVYSFSGSCPRYCLSFWVIGSFASLYFVFRLLGQMGDTPSSKRLLRGVILAAFFAGFIGLFLPLSGYSNGRFGYGGLGEGQLWGYTEIIRRMVNLWH